MQLSLDATSIDFVCNDIIVQKSHRNLVRVIMRTYFLGKGKNVPMKIQDHTHFIHSFVVNFINDIINK